MGTSQRDQAVVQAAAQQTTRRRPRAFAAAIVITLVSLGWLAPPPADGATAPGNPTYTKQELTEQQVRALILLIGDSSGGPEAPGGLTGAWIEDTVELRWQDRSNDEAGFNVYRRLVPGESELIGTTRANRTAFEDPSPVAGVTNTYRVEAYNGVGAADTAWVNVAPPPARPPAAPHGGEASAVSSSEIALRWTDAADDEAGFVVLRGNRSNAVNREVARLPADTQAWVDSGLAPDSTHFYRIFAFNAAGRSAGYAAASATTLTAGGTIRVRVTTTGPDPDEDGYRLTVAGRRFESTTMVAANGSAAFPDVPVGSYALSLDAITENCAVAASNPQNVTVTDASRVEAAFAVACRLRGPTGLQASASGQQLSATWTDPSSSETGFELQLDDNAQFSAPDNIPLSANVTSFATQLPPGTYYVRVRALHPAGASPYTPTAQVSVNELLPSGPGNGSASALSTSEIRVQWSDRSANETGFRVFRGTSIDAVDTEVAVLSPDTTEYTDQGLARATTYFYRVYAFNAAGSSTAFASAEATTTSGTGNIRVRSVTTGLDLDRTGYTVTIARGIIGTSTQLGINGFVTFPDRAVGTHQVTLGSIAANCTAGGDNPRDVVAADGELVETTYAVSCTLIAPTGVGASASGDDVTVTWRDNSFSESGYQVQYATNPSFSGARSVLPPSNAERAVLQNLSPGATYYIRVRALNASGNSSYSPSVSVAIQATRRVTIVNNMPTSLNLSEIVQFKVVQPGQLYNDSDYLTDDNRSDCLRLPGGRIASGGSRTFEIPYDDYNTYIGVGIWDLNNVTCGTFNPWFKRRFFTALPNRDLYWVWTEVIVRGHTSGEWVWTISGNYLNGNLVVTPEGSAPIQFNRTPYYPLP